MKKSLLEIVQDILNDMDGDTVNNIADTEESYQVARIVRSTFEDLITLKDAPHLRKFTTLGNVSDSTKPNYMKLPEHVSKVEEITYNQKKSATDRDRFKEVEYLYPDQFLARCNSRNVDNDNVTVVTDFDGATLNIITDQPPRYYTSFDDRHIVFDQWVEDLTTTVVEGDSQALLYIIPQFEMDSNYIPELPTEWFPLLIAEAKSSAIYKLRQVADEKEEQKSKRQQRAMGQRGWRAHGGVRYPNYGRQGRGRLYKTHLPKYYE